MPPEDDKLRRRQLVRAVVASTIGTTVEWIRLLSLRVGRRADLSQALFTNLEPSLANTLSYVTFYAGFVARPLGAAIFGHWGDRVGRKALLVATMVVMGVSTTAIGLVPTHETIGWWGAVLLTVLRALQGIAVGGEWSGSVLMAGEWAAPGRRGFTTSFPQMGAPLGMIMANTALSVMTSNLDEAAFLSWGWRVPFLASIVLVGIGLWIRIGILESPVFANLKAQKKLVRTPILETLKTNWREVVLTTLLRSGQLAPYYITTTYVLTYGTQVLGLSRAVLLNCVAIRSIGSLMILPVAGHLSDLLRPQARHRRGPDRHGHLDLRAVRTAGHEDRAADDRRAVRGWRDAGPVNTGRRRQSSRKTSRRRAGIQDLVSAITWRRSPPAAPLQ